MRVAFVTGGANGIGRAAAQAFAREGTNVAVAYISERSNKETARGKAVPNGNGWGL
jgi:NAD(P)-dependent dehydrogenase (short-subunit alcohol dehydrogenase family)